MTDLQVVSTKGQDLLERFALIPKPPPVIDASMLSASERLLSKAIFDKDTDCWLWIASKHSSGYGAFWFNCRMDNAHRVSYEIFVGYIPLGLFVLHRCDVEICINPAHLFIGSQSDNIRDAISKGRISSEILATKLTRNEVNEIRWLKGKRSQGELAKTYGVNQSHISRIQSGKVWTT